MIEDDRLCALGPTIMANPGRKISAVLTNRTKSIVPNYYGAHPLVILGLRRPSSLVSQIAE